MKIYKLPSSPPNKKVKPEDEAAFLEQCRKDNITPILVSDESQGQTSTEEVNQPQTQTPTEEVDQPRTQQAEIQAPFLESNIVQDVSGISTDKNKTKEKTKKQVDKTYTKINNRKIAEGLNLDIESPENKYRAPIDIVSSSKEDKMHQTAVQDIAFEDYLKSNKQLEDFLKLSPYDQKARKTQILNTEIFKNSLEKHKNESEKLIEERLNLNQQFVDGNIDEDSFKKAIKELNERDDYHLEFSEIVNRNNEFESLEKQVAKILEGVEGDERKGLYDQSLIEGKNVKKQVVKTQGEYNILAENEKNIFDEVGTVNNNITEKVTSIDQVAERLNKGWEWYIDNGGYKAEEADKLLYKQLVYDYEILVKDRDALIAEGEKIAVLARNKRETLDELIEDELVLKLYANEAKRSQSTSKMLGTILANSSIDLIQGGFGFQNEYVNFIHNDLGSIVGEKGLLHDALDQFGKNITSGGAKIALFEKLTGVNIPTPGDFFTQTFEHPETGQMVTAHEYVKEQIDDRQELWSSYVKQPIAYEDIEDFGDGVEWFLAAGAQQVPIYAAIIAGTIASGGSATPSLLALSMMQGGSQMEIAREDQKLWQQTGGIYGYDHSDGDVLISGAMSAAVTGLSERITFGLLKNTMGKVTNVFGKTKTTTNVNNFLNKNIFPTKNKLGVIGNKMFHVVGSGFEEGFLSEGFDGIGQNLVNQVFLGKEGHLLDGVQEQIMLGSLLGSQTTSIGVMADLINPWISRSTSQQINDRQNKLIDLNKQLDDLIKKGDPNAAKKIEDLKTQYRSVSNEIIKLKEQDIKRVNLLHPTEKTVLVEIDKKNKIDKKEINKISTDPNLSTKDRNKRISDLQKQIQVRENRKQQIIDKYPQELVDKNYEREVDILNTQAELVKEMGGVETNITSLKENDYNNVISKNESNMSQSQVENAIMTNEGIVNSMNDIVKDKNSTKQEIADAKEVIKKANSQINAGSNILQSSNSYGAMIPQFGKDGNLKRINIVLNKNKAIRDGKIHTAAHEFVHAAFKNTLRSDPQMRKLMGGHIKSILEGKGVTFSSQAKLDEFNKRVNQYDIDQRGEEMLAIASEMMVDGDISFNDSVFQKIKNAFRRFTQNVLGHDIELDTTEDIKNFMRDYHHSIKNNKPSVAIAKMMAKGANGKIFKDTRTATERKEQASFSQAVDLARKDNPDLKTEFDTHIRNDRGEPKHRNKEEFQNSPDFKKVYDKIIDGKLLDGLIQQGMVGKGVTGPALKDFTRKVKENLSMRLIQNFDPNKNESLFGWLTGKNAVLQYAKLDVQKEYLQQEEGKKTSIDKPIGEAGTLADIIQDEKDSLIDMIEDADMTPSLKQESIDDIQGLKMVMDVLNFPKDTRSAIENTIKESNVPLGDLTYKGIRNLLLSTEGKITTEKKAIPTGTLFNVLNSVSSEFGVDPLRILAKQDLNGEQRKLAQNYIFDKSINTDGSFNTDLLEILPEGADRSGQATGVANTKLGQLYVKGGRAKMKTGATAAGLATQTKRTNITKEEFLGIFGINPDGTFLPGTKADGAIRELIVQVSQLSANQGIRLNAINNELATLSIIAKISDGKSETMFNKAVNEGDPKSIRELSKTPNEVFSKIQKATYLDVSERALKKYPEGKDVEIPRMIDPSAPSPFLKGKTQGEHIDITLDRFFRQNPQFINLIKATTVFGIERSYYGTVSNFDKKHPIKKYLPKKKKQVIQVLEPKTNYTSGKKQKKNTPEIINSVNQDAKTKVLYDYHKAVEKHLESFPEDFAVFNMILSQTTNNQSGAYTRTQSSVKFHMVNEVGNTDLKQEVREEHSPQKRIGNMLLRAARLKMVDEILPVIEATVMQGSISMPDDIIINVNYKDDFPDIFYDEVLPLIRNGKLKLDKGLAAVTRLAVPHKMKDGDIKYLNLNKYVWTSTNKTIPEMFSVGIPKNTNVKNLDKIVRLQNDLIVQILTGKTTKQAAADIMSAQLKADSIISKDAKTKEDLNIIKKAKNNLTEYSKSGENVVMSTFDFDETLIVKGENFVIATDPKTKQTEKISSEDWPTRGTELMNEGWKFNFDDFVNVRGGVEGPLIQKLKNRIKKYGPKNNFVLTARPQAAAVAIHGWLKSKGIDIPLKNITGLANSTGEAKAQWMLEKFAEGYNDMYFVDDALPNVEAVSSLIEQLDIKGSSVQAKISFSKSASDDFNDMIERTSSVGAKKVFSAGEARVRGRVKGRWDFFIPPSAEDFKGLMYKFLGKGEQGNADMKWFKDNLFDPFAEGIRSWNAYKQNMADDYTNLKKKFSDIGKNINKTVPGTNFTNDTAIRVYLWTKNGLDIPGIAKTTKDKLVKHVVSNPDMVAFAETLSTLSKSPDGYALPSENWMVESIASDLFNTVKKGRKQFLMDWIDNKNEIFSKENLNKIESIHGPDYRDALENILYRMETGTNRVVGKDKTVNKFINWINGSVGAIMFLNIRSAALQTISMVNFVNWGDNNIFKASKAFANLPQFSKDFVRIFNSDMLKQRRGGSQIDIAHSELADAFSQSRGKTESIIRWLLEKGFEPTRIADSFAISMGGATFYRNRINTYIKNGMSKAKAETQAFLDFQEIAEETQQSSRPDLISGQQAGVLGRIILPFQNTPMQMTRLMKKATLDLINGRGDAKANISKIMYYGLVQNLIFGTLQSGLMFALFGADDEEDKERKKTQGKRVLNGALDTILRGTGVYGAALAAAKNTYKEWRVQRKKPYGKRQDYKIMQEAISLSPPVGSKFRKIMNAIKTEEYNRGVGKKVGFRIENPNLSIVGNTVEGLTNLPMARIIHKINNLEEAVTGNHNLWQRVALSTGWSMWSIGVKDEELEQAKIQAREERAKNRKIEKEKRKAEEKKAEEERKKKEGIKTVQCSGVRSDGERCKLTTETKAKTWKCPHHMEFKDGMDRDGDGLKEYRCTATKANGKRCNNKTENKNKKCYAHQ